jgi:DNA-binding winged helix-turn-helix (wHTH) protein/TolB-like protein
MEGHAKAIGTSGAPFRVGAFLVEPLRNRITGPSGDVSLQPKIIDVLCALAARQGEVVSRGELIDAVWGFEHGADESLTRAISQLRKIFDATRGEPRIIETIAKRGYRLAAPVTAADAGSDPPVGDARPKPTSKRRRMIGVLLLALLLAALAVAAFLATREDASPAPSARTGIVVTVEPFAANGGELAAEGLAGELATAIARSPLVRARTAGSSAEPGDALHFRLRGEIRRVGEALEVNARLADSATGEVIWGERYDQPYDAQFSSRDHAVAVISRDSFLPLLREVKAKLVRRPIMSLVPWELILLVTWVPGDETMVPGPPHENSYWLQRRALELDPGFAPAHALFAQLAGYHALFHPPASAAWALARAKGHAKRAIELAPYDAEVLYQLALYHRSVGNRDRAAAMLDRVLELQPTHPLAGIDRTFVEGQCGPGAKAAARAIAAQADALPRSSPVRWVALSHIAALELGAGDFVRAREAAIASRRIRPTDLSAITLAAADAELGRSAEAKAVLAEHRREWPTLDLDHFAETVAPRWCLGGPRAGQVQTVFRKLAAVAATAH